MQTRLAFAHAMTGTSLRVSRGNSDPTTVQGRNHVPVDITPEQREESRQSRL